MSAQSVSDMIPRSGWEGFKMVEVVMDAEDAPSSYKNPVFMVQKRNRRWRKRFTLLHRLVLEK